MRYAAITLLLMAACMNPDPPSDDVPVPQGGGAATEFSDPAVPIETQAGQEFAVVLQANATTGYSWALADSLDPRLVARVRDDYVPDPAPEGIAGSGGRERWTFRALAPGQTTVRMRYARSWEQPPADAETAAFRVIIRPAAP